MKQRILLAVAALLVVGVATPAPAVTLIQSFVAKNIAGEVSPPAYGMRADGFFTGDASHTVIFGFDNVLFNAYDDDTAELVGNVTVLSYQGNNAAAGLFTYALNAQFQKVLDPAGRPVMDYNASWDYYDLVNAPGHEMVNVGDPADFADLTAAPLDGTKPFRVGFGGNGKNGNFGASGWFNFAHTMGNDTYGNLGQHLVSSDFLMDLETRAVPEPASMALLGLGLLGGAGRFVRRRRTR